jgi:hypothetical protein
MSTSPFEKSNWVWQIHQMQQRVGEWWEMITTQNTPKISSPSWFDAPILQIIAKTIFWGIVGLLLTWFVWQIWQLLLPYLHYFNNPLRQSNEQSRKAQTRELSVAAHLERSRKFQQDANYREACFCLYMAMLQRLSDNEIAPWESSRTDGEYLQLIQSLPKSNPYQTLLMIHQQLCFSNAEASREVFEECQQAYREIEAS